MIQFTFYKIFKRRNSTAQPITGSGESVQYGEIKEPFNIENPQIIVLSGNGFLDPMQYNFVKIGAPLNRLYFIDTWSFDRGRYIADCALDVLGTWKTYIAVTRQYISRCSNLIGVDANIADAAYPEYPQVATQFSQITNSPWDINPYNGTYIMGIINNQTNYKHGCVQYYAFDYTAMCDFFRYMLSYEPDWLDPTETSAALIKALYDPMQFITDFYWMPIPYSQTSGVAFTQGEISYGWWSIPFNTIGHVNLIDSVNSPVYTKTIKIDIPKHPQKQRGTYLTTAQYNSYGLYYPPFGLIELDADQIGNANWLILKCTIDYRARTFMIEYCITNDPSDNNGTLVDRSVYENWGIDIPVGSLTTTQSGSILLNQASVGAAVPDFLSRYDILGLTDFFKAGRSDGSGGEMSLKQIATANAKINAGGANVRSMGGSGSLLVYTYQVLIVHKYKLIVEENLEEMGRPACREMILTTIPGFIQCATADIQSIPCTFSERQTIESFMINGFYLE